MPHTWGAVMRAMLGIRPRSCQLLLVRAHRPPQGSRSTNRPRMVCHTTGHAEAVADGAGLCGQGMHGWLQRLREPEDQDAPLAQPGSATTG